MASRTPDSVLLCMVTVTAFCFSGCTLIGLGVGASEPRYREIPVRNVSAVHDCETVYVDFTPSPTQKYERQARLLGADTGGLHMRLPDGEEVTTSWEYISHVSCADGSYLATGLAVGLALDFVAFAALVQLARAGEFNIWR